MIVPGSFCSLPLAHSLSKMEYFLRIWQQTWSIDWCIIYKVMVTGLLPLRNGLDAFESYAWQTTTES